MSGSCWMFQAMVGQACLYDFRDASWVIRDDELSEVGGQGARAPLPRVFVGARKQVCSGATSSAERASDQTTYHLDVLSIA